MGIDGPCPRRSTSKLSSNAKHEASGHGQIVLRMLKMKFIEFPSSTAWQSDVYFSARAGVVTVH